MREIYLCCIAKNEDRYIDEWIRYHFKLGFEKIVVYANDWDYKNDNPNVTVIECSGWAAQIPVYNHFLETYRNKFWWVGFWDVDEFLVLNMHDSVRKFLLSYDDLTAIRINWANFGSNGHKTVRNNDYSVLNRFTKRSSPVPYVIDQNKKVLKINQAVKSMLRFSHQGQMFVHEPEGISYTLDRKPMRGPGNNNVDYSVAQLNHYFIKSYDEMMIRITNGVPDVGRFKSREFYTDRDFYCNLIDDFAARNFMYDKKIVLEMI